MSHSSVGRQMDQLPKLISRTWQHRQGRLLILAVASLFLLAVWHMGSSSDVEAATSLPATSTLSSAKQVTTRVQSRAALSTSTRPAALQLDSSEKLDGMVSNSSRAFRPPGKFPVGRQDLVVAMPSDLKHASLIQASAAWRQELRTYIAVNTSLIPLARPVSPSDTELWRSYPDDVEEMMKWGCQTWEPRMALTPFFAHDAFQGEYEWILYGHDDTFFFVEGVLELLQDFDPSLPYVITDHFWWTDEPLEAATDFYHPNEYAPHCLPCHWTTQDEQRSMSRIDDYKPFTPYIGCPCTAEHICRNDKRNLYKKACNSPQEPLPFRMDAGAGVLISRGLMEKVPLEFMHKCIFDIKRAHGADDLFSRCLQQAGYAFTSPGYSFYHWEAKSFDPGPQHSPLLESTFTAAAAGAALDPIALDTVSHVITTHTKPERLGMDSAPDMMLKLQKAYDTWRAALTATQRPVAI